MANKTKFSKALIKDIMSELALGNSISSCLSPQNKKEDRPCWETFRSWLNKDDSLRNEYAQAKQDGIEFLLSDAQDLINDSLANSKLKDKTDLGQTHLVKAYIDLAKWKSERLSPKIYQKKDSIGLNFDKNTPLVVKWSNT
jgi:hypothetical protein